jgi:hypothetical protein
MKNNLNQLLRNNVMFNDDGSVMIFQERLHEIMDVLMKEIPRSSWHPQLKSLLEGDKIYVRDLYRPTRCLSEEERLTQIRQWVEKILHL